MFMALLDIQIVATSLPVISSALQISSDQMSWVQTAYLTAEVISIPLTGWLTHVLTFRFLFIGAIAGFTLASIGCAASIGFASLTAWRVAQGFSGGMLVPMVSSAVFLLPPRKFEGIAATIAGLLAVLAPTLGPVVGGWNTDTYSWHWIFLINVLTAIACLFAGAVSLPRHRLQLALFRTLDWISHAFFAIALSSLEIGLKEAPKRGWLSVPIILIFPASILAGFVFVHRSLQNPTPVVELTIFRDARFAAACCPSFLVGAGIYGSVYLMPVFLSLVRGQDPFAIGKIMLVTGVTQMIVAPMIVWSERRASAVLLSAIGFLVFGIGLGLSPFQSPQSDFEEMFWPQVIRGGAVMLCILPPTRLALRQLNLEQVPNASSLFNLMRNLGGAIEISLADTLIWSRVPEHAHSLMDRLSRGEKAAAEFIGIPASLLSEPLPSVSDPTVQAFLEPLVEKAALTIAINDTWLLIGSVVAAGSLVAAGIALSGKMHPSTNPSTGFQRGGTT
jgi:DHA2 family multidrug resistance protein